jgi:hypothetical protein
MLTAENIAHSRKPASANTANSETIITHNEREPFKNSSAGGHNGRETYCTTSTDASENGSVPLTQQTHHMKKAHQSASSGTAKSDCQNRKYIIGDSIVKGIGQYMRENVCAVSYPGAQIENLNHVISNFSESPDEISSIVLHIGSNDLQAPIDEIVKSMRKLLLATLFKFPSSNIILSGPLLRTGVSMHKIMALNQKLFYLCGNIGVHFVDCNFLIDSSGLSKGGVHLNEKGKQLLSNVLLDYIQRVEKNKLIGVREKLHPHPLAYAEPSMLSKNL